MARPLRIEFPGALYHVMSRGNNRSAIVLDDTDRSKRLDWLRRTVQTYHWRLHAFALLTNHEHLFVETPQPNLSAAMQFLNGSYTSYYNRRHERVGHLFQGRFKSHLIEEKGHYLAISRYIHLNAYRANLVPLPEDYRWSSYPGYVRPSQELRWVAYTRVLREFGRDLHEARIAYKQFIHEGMRNPPKSPWVDALYGLLVGSNDFIARVRKKLKPRQSELAIPQLRQLQDRPSLQKIISVTRAAFGDNAQHWAVGHRNDDYSRATAAYLARRRFGYPASQVAEVLGYSSASGVAKAVRRIDQADRRHFTAIQRIEKAIGDAARA